MALEHDDAPRFTLDQRDAILNLAARLQVQHEATVGADELVREAQAAGIDARFVYEATVRLGRKSRPASPRAALFAFSILALQAVLVMVGGHGLSHRGEGFGGAEVVVGACIALLLSLWAAQARSIRRYVPVVAFATWVSVGFATVVVESQLMRDGYFWVVPTAMRFGFAETLAAVVAVLARSAIEWSPKGRSFLHHRGEKA